MAGLLDTIYTVWLRELIRFTGSRSRLVGTGGQPLIWLAIAGVGFGSAFALAGGVPYLTFIGPGIIGMTLLFSSIFAGINVIWDKQFGFMKEILVAPVPRSGIVLGKIAGSATVSMITAFVILIVEAAFKVIPIGGITALGLVEAIIFMLLVAAVFVSIGLVIASYLDNIEGFNVIVNFLVLPLFFLSGALFPLTNAPLWMRVAASLDPLRYGVDGLRGALVGVHVYPIYIDLAIDLAAAILLILIADISFRRMQAK